MHQYGNDYDNFTSAVIIHLEDLGFYAKREGGPFGASVRATWYVTT
jgi:hypothetical protein